MATDDILDEIEHLILEAGRVPFTNKRVIEEDDLVRLLDELRTDLPRELQEAQTLLKEKKQLLEAAQDEANKIIEQAKTYAIKLTNEHPITLQAQEQAKELMDKTTSEVQELREDSVRYADEVFQHLDKNVSQALEVIRQAHTSLKQQLKK